MKKNDSKPGRPAKGDKKRVRVSMTLDPRLALWVQEEAAERGMSASMLAEELISYGREARGKKASVWETRLGVYRDQIAAFCRSRGIDRLALFGSALREDFRDTSDVDLLVRFKKDDSRSLLDFARVKEAFEMLFGRSVDLVEEASLTNPIRRREILKSLRWIYEAQAS